VDEGVAQRDQAAHAVAQHEQRHAGRGLGHAVDERVDIGDDVVKALDEGPRAVGAAVPAVV
jgi:hypothetical protein